MRTISEMAPRWRGSLFGVLLLVVYIVAQLAIGTVSARLGTGPRTVWRIGAFALGSVAGLYVYRRGIRLAERREPGELPLTPGLDPFLGLLIGIGLLSLTQGCVIAFGGAHIASVGSPAAMVAPFAAALFAAIWEEAIFRGMLFRIVAEKWGPGVALVVSAVIFGGLHLINPGATWLGVIAIAVEAGIMLGLAFLLTRNLWLAIGIHWGWNFAEGGIFGSAVSGTVAHGWIKVVSTGPALLTGGAFGLEASLPAIAIGIATSMLFLMLLRRRGLAIGPAARVR